MLIEVIDLHLGFATVTPVGALSRELFQLGVQLEAVEVIGTRYRFGAASVIEAEVVVNIAAEFASVWFELGPEFGVKLGTVKVDAVESISIQGYVRRYIHIDDTSDPESQCSWGCS